MNFSKVETELNNIFNNTSSKRKIVMWYDENQEFIDDIDNIKLDNAELYKLTNNNWIYSEYFIEFENPNINYLVYAPFEKPSDEDNYLSDMTHYATLFSANKVNLIAQELDVPYEYKEILNKYSKFWNANSRFDAFKELNIEVYNKSTIELGILCVLTGVKTINLDNIIRKVIVENTINQNNYIEIFKKFNISDAFWNYVYKKYGYLDDEPSIDNLIKFLILNYTASLIEGKIPKSWDEFVIDNKNNSRVFIDNFMNHNRYREIYDSIVSDKENKWKINNAIKNMNVESYIKCDSFEIFDKKIISYYIDLLYGNKESINLDDIINFRKKTHFYKKYENEYQLIKWANSFINLINEFEYDILPEDVNELIDLFTKKYVNIDKSYRKFYYFYDKIHEIDNLENLRQLIENMYNNTFLSTLNLKFTSLIENIDDIKIQKQWNFYKNNIPQSVKKHRTAVIISDAFRYGCAVELKDELDKNPTRNTSLIPMLASLPSYTSLGMASLLPHRKITYDDGNVLVDGNLNKSIEDRNKILKYYNSKSVAVGYDDIVELTLNDLRKFIKGTNLIYIYHNQVDARGDHSSTENEVFDASQEAISEIIDLITKLTNVSLTNIYITADHGFIYKRDKLNEGNKLDLENIPTFYKNKRFLLLNDKYTVPGAKTFSLNYIGNDNIYVIVPRGTDIFKSPGNGLNYVHGGLSLEESIIPLMKVNSKKGAKNQDYVGLQLTSTKRKIVNYEVMLSFFQEKNISSTVLPLKASIYFVDSDGNKISNEVLINADVNSEYSEDREFKEKFTLEKEDYSKNKTYYLIIKNIDEDIEINRFEFIIDIAFKDDFSFF